MELIEYLLEPYQLQKAWFSDEVHFFGISSEYIIRVDLDWALNSVIKMLENKLNLIEIEKDILDGYYELSKNPVDRDSVIKQIRINKKYNILKEEVALAEFQTGGKAISIPFEELSTDELRGNLYNQLFILCSKIKKC